MSWTSAEARIYEAALRLFAERGATQLTVSELADAAGVARGTIYNNVPAPESLLEQVAGKLASEMYTRIAATFGGVDDPALRLAMGVRYFLKRAHEEPHWGRFLCRFALTEPSLQALWSGPAMTGVQTGIALGRYSLRPEQIPAAMSALAGTVVASCYLVVEGHRTWRDAGSDAAELVLRAFGVPNEDARRLSTAELPALAKVRREEGVEAAR
jgi:AcrR family transcriptional regulator